MTQCVILGAGLDTFAHRQPPWARAGLRVVLEVDHPASQADKRARLAAAGVEAPRNVRFAALDFEATTLADGLAASGVLDAAAPVFCVCLGVFMYLTADAIEALLRTVVAFGRGSELAFSFMPAATLAEGATGAAFPDVDGGGAAAAGGAASRVEAQAAALGEPMLSKHTPEELTACLLRAGFTSVRMLSAADAAVRLGPDLCAPQRVSIGSACV